jgi:hypothetical protein
MNDELYTVPGNMLVSSLSFVEGTIYVFKQDSNTNIGYTILLKDSNNYLVADQDVIGEAGYPGAYYPGAYTRVTIGTEDVSVSYEPEAEPEPEA